MTKYVYLNYSVDEIVCYVHLLSDMLVRLFTYKGYTFVIVYCAYTRI